MTRPIVSHRIQALDIDTVIFYLATLALLSFLPLFLTAPKHIFSFLLLCAILYKALVHKASLRPRGHPLGLFALGLFLAALLLSSALSSDPAYSLKMVWKHYAEAFLIAWGFLISVRDEKQIKTLILALAAMTVVTDMHYYLKAARALGSGNITLPEFRIDRNFSYVIPLMFPFLLAAWWLIERGWLRLLLLPAILGTLLLGLLTGRRAGYFSVGMEALLFLGFYLKTAWEALPPRKKAGTLALALVAGGLLLAAVSQTKQFQAALERGLSPNGRDVILQDRFPILKEHFLLGAGYGQKIYDDLLIRRHVPRRYGRMEHGRFTYWADEGTYIQVLFRNGLAGFAALLIFLFYPLVRLMRQHAQIRPAYLLMWAVGLLIFEQYLLRGFVSTFILSNLLPFFALFLAAEQILTGERA